MTSLPVTKTLTGVTTWLPTSIIQQPSSKTITTGEVPTATSTGIPTSLPKAITTNDVPNQPNGTQLIQISFLYAENYEFIATNPLAAAQIFSLMPQALAHAGGFEAGDERIQMLSIEPYDTSKPLGYITSQALIYFPEEAVDQLRLDVKIPQSELYNHEAPLVRNLTREINPAIDIILGSTLDGPGNENGNNDGKPGNTGAPNNDPFSGGGDGGIDIGDRLREFREFTMVLTPEFRGEALSNSALIRGVHNSFARSSPFADDTQRGPDAETEDAFHFVAYAPIGGTLYELDGLQPAPISHGPCADADFPARVVDVLQRRVARYDLAEIRFNLMAMCRDLRVSARQVGDAETLAREDRKRRDWQFENALRRHNFVGFAGAVLKAVVASKLAEGGGDGGDGAYGKWVEEAKARTRHRIETRKKGSGGGEEDIEMGG